MKDERWPQFSLARWLFGLAGLIRREEPFPPELAIAGLSFPAELGFDAHNVPHIRAETMMDAFRLEGYLHGRLRGFQMDFFRRMPAGELSELLGPETIPYDLFMRQLNLRRWALESMKAWSQETQDAILAYTEGVNQALDQETAPEYRFLKRRPRPWAPLDTSLLTYFLSWSLNSIWTSKWAYDQWQTNAEVMEWLFGDLPGCPDTTIIKNTGTPLAWGGIGIGSNNWVVRGERSGSGRPLLANDPHLMPLMPSIWFPLRLDGGPLSAQGVSLPGAPGIVIGQNRKIAWGVTNVEPDCQDLFRITMETDTHYQLDDQRQSLTRREEHIAVRGEKDRIVTMEESHAGPIIHREDDGSRIALSWTGLGPVTTVNALLRLNLAGNWDEFRTALKHWTLPAQNFVYADRDGHIGYQLAGTIPLHRGGPHLGVANGNSRSSLAESTVAFDDLPHVLDPEEGYIVTANNPVKGRDGRPFLARNSLGFRAERIETLMAETPKHTRESFAAIQVDVWSKPLSMLADLLIQAADVPDDWKAILRSFDGRVLVDSSAPTLLYLFAQAAVPPSLKEALHHPFFPGTKSSAPGSLPFPENYWALMGERLVPAIIAHFPEIDRARACHAAFERGQALWGAAMANWTWGRAHHTVLFHPFTEVRLLRALFGLTPRPAPGDFYTPHQAAFPIDPHLPWPRAVSFQPSYRQILTPGAMGEGQFMHLTGQSGHPLSAHHHDLVRLYEQQSLIPWDGHARTTRVVPR